MSIIKNTLLIRQFEIYDAYSLVAKTAFYTLLVTLIILKCVSILLLHILLWVTFFCAEEVTFYENYMCAYIDTYPNGLHWVSKQYSYCDIINTL